MANEGFLEIDLRDVVDQPAHDANTRVRFFRSADNTQIALPVEVSFPPVRRFALPAFPQEKNLFCETSPSRFRRGNTGLFTLTDGKVTRRNPVVLRSPDKWTPQFVTWNQLSNDFLPLKDVLEASPDIKVKTSITLATFVRDTYDNVTNQKAILAKMALLNLYAALTLTIEPISEDDSWFSFVKQILLLDRERFIAFADPKMAQIIRTIKDAISQFPDYKHTPAENHFEGIQAAVPEGFKVLKSRMFSIKTDVDHANIQLTIAPTKDLAGNEVTVVDADIDENGRLLAHLADLIKHKINGGTHPVDIHEYLLLAHPTLRLGYNLT